MDFVPVDFGPGNQPLGTEKNSKRRNAHGPRSTVQSPRQWPLDPNVFYVLEDNKYSSKGVIATRFVASHLLVVIIRLVGLSEFPCAS